MAESSSKSKKMVSATAESGYEGKKVVSAMAESSSECKKVVSATAESNFESKKEVSATADTIKMNINPVSATAETTKITKMKIKGVKLSNLRNDEHFQFMQFVLVLTKETGVDNLKVTTQYETLAALHAQEDEALMKITKSALTAKIDETDAERDTVFRGLTDAVKSACGHYLLDMRETAQRVMIALDTYGNIATKSHIEETAAMYNLCNDLQTKYKNDMARLNLLGWVGELQRLNNTVEQLLGSRADEGAERTALVLKEVRAQIDDAYRALTAMVQAQALVSSVGADAAVPAMYKNFINRLNERIDMVNNALAQRRGIAKKAAERAKKKEQGE